MRPEMHAERRKFRLFPRTLGECIEPVTRPAMQEHGITEMRIIRYWENIVGQELARHASPHRIIHTTAPGGENGVLVVQASGGFATQIQHMEPVILERLATYFGYRAVTRLKIEQATRPAASLKPVRSFSAKRVTDSALALPVEVEDPEIRAALIRLEQALQKQPS